MGQAGKGGGREEGYRKYFSRIGAAMDEKRRSLAVGCSSIEQPQEGESEGNMIRQRHHHRVTIYQGHVC